ncbi:hypothetical protein [Flectobacillus sp. BAB-3569]|uniref:hypothetical protein n=1 Tax=Flectobacillus sp. BAB-3569 TaxID=1509483 RepID=UPI000BA44413|nr:hypothetical protein [Flectobacillus sp. BAB-3569]PAC33172.1 hypothetical protein BWI92_01285 [Flectobacillus sp. BAB-3569]
MKKIISIDAIKKFGFEFLSIFIGVFAAFALDSWNETRKDKYVEIKILSEINNGLKQDVKDIMLNMEGHQQGIQAASYFQKVILNQPVSSDSIRQYHFRLFRNFISIQNSSGYQTLKSKGLEIIENDSLRLQILSLYENDFNSIRKLEEDYSELQFHQVYYNKFNDYFSSNLILDAEGKLSGIRYPIILGQKEKNILLLDLWRIKRNRMFIISTCEDVIKKIKALQKNIEEELQ